MAGIPWPCGRSEASRARARARTVRAPTSRPAWPRSTSPSRTERASFRGREDVGPAIGLLLAAALSLAGGTVAAAECQRGGGGMDSAAASAFARWSSGPGRPKLEAHCPLGAGIALAVAAGETAPGGEVYLATGGGDPVRVAGG